MRAELFEKIIKRKTFATFANLLIAAVLCCAAPAAFAQQPVNAPETGQPVALLIANSTYPDAGDPLKHPLKDARKLADELKKRGFAVLPIGQDLPRDQMRAAIDAFYEKITAAKSAALIYFSGYGLQSSNGRSYMIPANAQIWSDSDVRRDGFDVQSILDEMSIRGAALKIAILDASRRTPWERRFRDRSIGLAPVVGNKGSIVIYAAAPNTVVDDEDGENSLFMRHLLKGIQAPGLTVEQAFFRTRNEVSQASKGEQVPWVSSFVMGDVYINPPVQAGQQQQSLQAPSARPDPCAPSEAHWKSAEGLGTKVAFSDHLTRFANCPFATLAQARIEALDQAEVVRTAAAAPAPAPPPAPVPAAPSPAVPSRQFADAGGPVQPSPRTAPEAACGLPSPGRAQVAMGGPLVPISIRPDLAAAKSVRALEFSPDGMKFATAGDDGTIRLWDASTLRPIQTLKADQDPIYALAFWTDGSLLASASATGTVRVWKLENGRVVNTFKAGSDTDGKSLRQFGVAFYPGKPLQFVNSVGDDGRVWIWDLQQNNLRRMRQNLTQKAAVDPTIRSISFAPNPSGDFVTASFDGAIRFYSGRGDPGTFEAYSGKALRVAYSPDGSRVVSAGVDKGLKNLKLWDSKTRAVVRNLEGHTDYVISAAWSADGKRLVSGGGGKDRVVRVWDAERGTQVQALIGHRDDVEAVAFFPRKDWVVSVSEDKTLKVWDIGRGRELLSIVAFADGEYLAYTPLGCYAGSSGAEQHFKVVAEGVARDVSSETRKSFFLPGGIAPLLTAMER